MITLLVDTDDYDFALFEKKKRNCTRKDTTCIKNIQQSVPDITLFKTGNFSKSVRFKILMDSIFTLFQSPEVGSLSVLHQ